MAKIVTLKIHNDVIRRILDRTTRELDTWAREVLHEKVEPVTPIDTGELRKNTAVSVKTDGQRNLNIWWYWRQPYAAYVEDMRDRGASPRTPGTIAPFAEPTIRKAILETFGGVVKRGFEGP